MSVIISVREADFDVGQEYLKLTQNDTTAGAVVTFVGRVRDKNIARTVNYLELEHYPAMTEKLLQEIVEQASQRWAMIRCTIIHRVGRLSLGDQIVFVGVTSEHRADAFHAAEFLMDYLKTQAPFWKKEFTESGVHWVEAQEKDQQAASAWII